MNTEILLFEVEQPDDLAVYAEAIGREHPGVVVLAAGSVEEALRQCPAAEILAAKAHDISAEIIASMPALKWIQALTTGTDHLATLDLPSDCIVTSTRGMHGPQMAELAFLYMLALTRDFPRMYRNQQAAHWERWPQRLLFNKTAVVVGVGAISEALAVRCKAFGMRVLGVSSHRTQAAGFDAIEPRARLESLASEADFLIVLVPYTPETHHMIDASVIGALPPHAALINIARGKVVDEQALIAALGANRLRGVGLDVFETEPLPKESPLWSSSRSIITPRIGGMSDIFAQQAAAVLVENLTLFLKGARESMRNLVQL
jgi:phosphoglycerate dehydrogenase-like enzyme